MFKTENEAHVYIVEAVRYGTFKNCVHLTTFDTDDYSSKPWEPHCRKYNFVRSGNRIRCPDTCYSFEDMHAAETAKRSAKRQESRRGFWRAFWRTVSRPFTLPWQTQMLIVVSLFIAWGLATNQLKTVLEIVRALRGSK